MPTGATGISEAASIVSRNQWCWIAMFQHKETEQGCNCVSNRLGCLHELQIENTVVNANTSLQDFVNETN